MNIELTKSDRDIDNWVQIGLRYSGYSDAEIQATQERNKAWLARWKIEGSPSYREHYTTRLKEMTDEHARLRDEGMKAVFWHHDMHRPGVVVLLNTGKFYILGGELDEDGWEDETNIPPDAIVTHAYDLCHEIRGNR